MSKGIFDNFVTCAVIRYTINCCSPIPRGSKQCYEIYVQPVADTVTLDKENCENKRGLQGERTRVMGDRKSPYKENMKIVSSVIQPGRMYGAETRGLKTKELVRTEMRSIGGGGGGAMNVPLREHNNK